MTELTQTQESVARSWCDPESVLTREELTETASCCLRSAAAELRDRARYLAAFYLKPGDPVVGYTIDHLRARADELDRGLS